MSDTRDSKDWADQVIREVERSVLAFRYWSLVAEMVQHQHPIKVYLMYGVTKEYIQLMADQEGSRLAQDIAVEAPASTG